jgi:hypothetical protein
MSLPGGWEFLQPQMKSWMPFTGANNEKLLKAVQNGDYFLKQYFIL